MVKEKKSKHKTKKSELKGKNEKKEKKDKKDKKARKDKLHKEDGKSKELNEDSKSLSTSASILDPTTAASLTLDDFFLKNEHFRVWCSLLRKKPFESLTSEESHALFANEFCQQYNRHELPNMFYKEQLPLEMREAALKTKHKWNIRVGEAEAEKISTVAGDVDFRTRQVTEGAWKHMVSNDVGGCKIKSTSTSPQPELIPAPAAHRPSSLPIQNKQHQSQLHNEQFREEAHLKQKEDQQKARSRLAVLLEEEAPKETGRLAVLDKRKGISAGFREAAREREDARDGLDMRESDIMGGGDDFARCRSIHIQSYT